MERRKKALAILTGPQRLLQVFWLTLLYSEYDWSLLIHRFSEDNKALEEVKEYCVRAESFEKIYIDEDSALYSNIKEKIICFLKMFFYFIFGKRKMYCRKKLEEYVDIYEYDLLCLTSSNSIIEGAALNFSDEIQTIMMQDGLLDYVYSQKSFYGVHKLVGKLLFKMKYFNYLELKGFYFNRNCIKYATNPAQIIDKSFLEIRQLFDKSKVSEDEYEKILKKVYQIEEVDYDVILFSSITQSIRENEDMEKLREWLNQNYKGKRILIKKHPHDIYPYEWDELNISCKYTNIPGEIIIKLAKKAEFIYAFPSTLLLSMIYEDGYDYKIIKYQSGMQESYVHNVQECFELLNIQEDKRVCL